MATQDAADALVVFEHARLKPRYGLFIGTLMAHGVVELFDLYLVGYLVSVIGPQWKLTFGQVSIMLLMQGVGQICGALPLARAADQWGRKPVLIVCILIYALAAGGIALVPDGHWRLFAALRFVVGFGFAGAGAAQIALIVEFSPNRLRTLLSNGSGALAPIGVMLASASAAFMVGMLGWRGLAALGAIPTLFALALIFIAPESPRWLIAKGRAAQARDIIARHIDALGVALSPPAAPAAPAPTRMADLYAWPGRFWLVVAMAGCIGIAGFSVAQWGPALLALLLKIPPAKSAAYFIFVSMAGLAGRFLFTIAPNRIGRWRATLICLWASAAALACAAVFHGAFIGTLPVFFLCLLAGAVFYDGGFSNIPPYCVELFPVRMAAHGGGLGQTVTGVAKVAGPALLALVAGQSNLLSPKATEAAILPAFLMLAGFCVIGAIAVSFLRYETHGRSMAILTPQEVEATLQAETGMV